VSVYTCVCVCVCVCDCECVSVYTCVYMCVYVYHVIQAVTLHAEVQLLLDGQRSADEANLVSVSV
jgi:hypothetical protein